MSEYPKVKDPNPPGPNEKKTLFTRFLDFVEWLGNLLPHPVSLFALFALGVVLISGITAAFDLQVEDPRGIAAKSKFTVTGIEDGLLRVKNADGNPLELAVVEWPDRPLDTLSKTTLEVTEVDESSYVLES